MRRTSLTLTSLLALVALSACTTTIVGGIRGSGNMETETRDVSGFSEIVVEGSGTVDVEVTGTESLTIEAEDNLLPRLTSDVEGGRLVLGVSGSITTTRGIVYTITAASLEGIVITGSADVDSGPVTADGFTVEISGSGTVDLAELSATSLDVTIPGSGDMEVAGVVDDLEVTIPGSGTFRAEALEAATGTVTISGSGDAVVNVSDSLDVTISGSGTVEYLGSPAVSTSISGSGDVRQR